MTFLTQYKAFFPLIHKLLSFCHSLAQAPCPTVYFLRLDNFGWIFKSPKTATKPNKLMQTFLSFLLSVLLQVLWEAASCSSLPLYSVIFNLRGLRKAKSGSVSEPSGNGQFPEEKLATCFLYFHSAVTFRCLAEDTDMVQLLLMCWQTFHIPTFMYLLSNGCTLRYMICLVYGEPSIVQQ